jgi:hypothetical protein
MTVYKTTKVGLTGAHHPIVAAMSALPPLACLLTAPGWQGFSSRLQVGRCSHVFGLFVRFT